MQTARTLEPVPQHSPLKAARVRRQLSADEAARRSGLTADEISWLEEGRVYRFPTTDSALLACLVYAGALDIDFREARELAGLPAPPRRGGLNPAVRMAAVAAVAALVAALAVAVVFARFDPRPVPRERVPAVAGRARGLPPPWRIRVDVLNGSGDINHTRRVADRVTALGYRVVRVRRATRFDYVRTAVYYEPGGERVAVRLARALGVATQALPAGHDPLRAVVIVGPPRGPDEGLR